MSVVDCVYVIATVLCLLFCLLFCLRAGRQRPCRLCTTSSRCPLCRLRAGETVTVHVRRGGLT